VRLAPPGRPGVDRLAQNYAQKLALKLAQNFAS
jgi:hypothetical protein